MAGGTGEKGRAAVGGSTAAGLACGVADGDWSGAARTDVRGEKVERAEEVQWLLLVSPPGDRSATDACA
jgi:hypothetical protein